MKMHAPSEICFAPSEALTKIPGYVADVILTLANMHTCILGQIIITLNA